MSGGGGGGGVFSRANSTALAESALSRSRSVEVGLLVGSGELGDVELRMHGRRGETAAALALEVVDDGTDGEPPAAVATAGDDGVGVAGLDALRRKTVLRRDETEPARARPCVGRSPAALSGASTASLSTALAADELLGSQRFESAVSCASSNGSRACQKKQSISVLRRETVLAALAASHAAQHVGLSASCSRFKLSASSNAGHAHFATKILNVTYKYLKFPPCLHLRSSVVGDS